jgi:glycosyltransferase involved in cell wall biosynthesis
VIYVLKSDTEPGVEEILNGTLSEKIIYYRPAKTGIGFLDKFLSHQRYKSIYRKAIKGYIRTNGKPDCVHVHVAMKAGLMALWMKKKWKIPFLVTEHWTGYLTEADQRIEHFSFLFSRYIKNILEKASLITVVSNHLGKAMQQHFPGINYRVVPNVVDTDIFFPITRKAGNDLQMIHVSNMNYQKNTADMISALQLLKQQGLFFTMQCYGPVRLEVQEQINAAGLQDRVFLNGEVPQVELSKAMQRSDLLILYSRFETFGCVLIEANATGIPVVVSDIKVFHELVTENVNGIFCRGEDPVALAETLTRFSTRKLNFDPEVIAGIACRRFSYNIVGKQFAAIYEQLTAAVPENRRSH